MATSDVGLNTTANPYAQTRQDFQYSATVNGLMKNVYLPALNNVTMFSIPLLTMFGDFGGTVDFRGNKLIKGFKTQLAGGFGAIPEGGDWVSSKKMKGIQGAERIKYLNAFCSLTGPAARTVKQGDGAYVEAIADSMDDTLKYAQTQMERIVSSNGKGTVGAFTVASNDLVASTAKQATFSATYGGYSACQWLQEGMLVDICSDTSGTLVDATNGVEVAVTAIDYDNDTAYLTAPGAVSLTAGTTYYLTLHDAYGDVETEGGFTENVCLEPNGLMNLVSDGTTAGETDYTTIWGLDRTTAAYARALKSKVVAAGGQELDEILVMGWILDLVNYRQSVPDVLVCGPKARLKYFSNQKEDRRFNTQELSGSFGFSSLGVTIDQYTLMLQSLSSLRPDALLMLSTAAFKWFRATQGWFWVTSEMGNVFKQKEGSDNLYASAINYCQLVCEDPKGQFKATGIAYT